MSEIQRQAGESEIASRLADSPLCPISGVTLDASNAVLFYRMVTSTGEVLKSVWAGDAWDDGRRLLALNVAPLTAVVDGRRDKPYLSSIEIDALNSEALTEREAAR